MDLNCKPGRDEDIVPVRALWNRIIDGSTITFTSLPKTTGEIAAAMARQPFLVARTSGAFAGFALVAPFRPGPGYAHVGEVTLYLEDAFHGTGAADALLAAIEEVARQTELSILVAGVSGENPRAQKFFSRNGYAETARMPGLGRKFGRSLDLVLLQKTL